MSVKLKNAFGALVVLSVFTTFIFTLHLYRTPPSRAFGTSNDFEALALDSLAAAKGSSRFSADLKEFLLGDVVRTSKDSEALSPHVVNAPKEFRSSGDLRGHLTSDDTQEDSEEDTKEDHQEDPEESDFQALHREMGIGGKAVVRPKEREQKGPRMVRTDSGESFMEGMFYTHDDWPKFSSKVYKNRAPKTPYDPPHAIQWDFNVSAFLQRLEVKGRPPKLITWMAPMKYLPKITEPVRLRTCPGMPCRMTTNVQYRQKSAALIWNVENIRGVNPPARPHPDQVFIFHNQERPEHHHMAKSTYRTSAWRSVFNWTMSFRFDSDILDVYGYLSKRPVPLVKNYTAIMARKTKMASWIVSHCKTTSRREEYVDIFQKYIPVDIYGKCGPHKCARRDDDKCLQTIDSSYKFFLSFENAICKDYITEKLFRYMEADLVMVVRGGTGYERHAPPGTYINTADFKTIQDLVAYLQHLDKNPEEYLKILRAKDQYVPMYEEYPHRNQKGKISYVHYQYEAVAYCELCRRLWNIDQYRKSYPDMTEWFDKGVCTGPTDLP